MGLESGVFPAGQRARRRVLTALVALVALAALVAPASGQVDDEPPWRDLDQASRQLADAQVRILDSRDALREAKENLDNLLAGIEANAEDTVEIATGLQAAQDRARRLAVEVYIAGGPVADSLYVLDSSTANDWAYRATLLTESVGAVASSQADYYNLRDQASEEAIVLAERIDGLQSAIESAEREIAAAEAALPAAEWVVYIAEIHHGADDLMERYGRIEPTLEDWDQLRFCESTRDYQTNTGNGYFGAYQFNVTTWVDMGGSGLPSNATVEEQDARARYLYALRGSGYDRGGAWPVCGRFLPSG